MAPSWGDDGAPASDTSNCNLSSRETLMKCMDETEKLVRTTRASLQLTKQWLFPSTSKSKKKSLWDRCPPKIQNKLKHTFFTFFGEVHMSDHQARTQAADAIDRILKVLERFSGRNRDNWPPQILFFCDVKYLHVLDPNGRDGDAVDDNGVRYVRELTEGEKEKRKVWLWDAVRQEWTADYNEILNDTRVAAHTRPFVKPEVQDRITFTARWLKQAEEFKALPDLKHSTKSTSKKSKEAEQKFMLMTPENIRTIKEGKALLDFLKHPVKLFFHEHLHTFYFNNTTTYLGRHFGDIEGFDSYGPENAARIAQEKRFDEKHFRGMHAYINIENLVWYAIASSFNDWDFSSGYARKLDATRAWQPPIFSSPAANATSTSTIY